MFALRGLPAGWLGAYGNEWVGTPNLDRVAAEGVVFDRHVSDRPDPDAANRAWLTGRHQIPPMEERTPRADSRILLPALREAGVRTVIVRANHPDTDADTTFYDGWDEVFDARPQAEDNSPLDALIRSFPSLLDKLGTTPRWLVWVETDRLLPPWDVPQDVFEAYLDDEGDEDDEDAAGEEDGEDEDEADEVIAALDAEPEEAVEPFADPPTGPFDNTDLAAWEWLHSTFAAVMTALDAELGLLFDELRPRGLDQTATWVVTSDLGYPLGEHGQVGLHRPWLHEELVHVPLVVRLPGAAEAGRRVPALTQPADLAPTLFDLFGVNPIPEAVQGHSLLPLTHGREESVRPYVCSGLGVNGAEEWAIRTADWALLVPGRVPEGDPPRERLLFEKPDDRWEVNDLRSRNVEKADELEETLRKYVAAAERPGPLVIPPLGPPGNATDAEQPGAGPPRPPL